MPGPIDLLFVDAAKEQYAGYIELAEPKLSERAVLVARRLNAELVQSERWLACVLPVGDGIALAARRAPA